MARSKMSAHRVNQASPHFRARARADLAAQPTALTILPSSLPSSPTRSTMRPPRAAQRALSSLLAAQPPPACRTARAPHAPRAYHASVLPSLISPGSPEFQERARSMDALVAELEEKLAAARAGGGPKAVERMRSKGKMTPRER